MAGFSQDLPLSPQSMLQRLNTTSTNSSSSSSSEIDLMKNRIFQMQALATKEREVWRKKTTQTSYCELLFSCFQSADRWRHEAEDNHRLAVQYEQEKVRAIQQRDDALHQIEQMRQLLIHNVRLLPNDQDLMQLPLDQVRTLQNQLQQELSKLALVSCSLTQRKRK